MFFGDTPLNEISADRVEEFRLYLLNQKYGPRRISNASVNRHISLLRHAFNCALSWKDAAHNPVSELEVKMLKEQPKPTRVLEEGEEQTKLLDELPPWLRLMALFALQTRAQG